MTLLFYLHVIQPQSTVIKLIKIVAPSGGAEKI